MKRNRIAIPALWIALIFTGACILEFDDGVVQSIALHFALAEALPEDTETLVHTLHYPFELQLKKRWVRIAGILMAPDGGELPAEVAVGSLFEAAETGRRLDRRRGTATIDEDGRFSVSVKMRKNLPSDAMQMIFVEPRGADLEAGTRIWLCVDVVEKKRDLGALPACAADDDDDPQAQPGTVVVEVLDNAFDPKRVRVQPGDTVRWVLTGLLLNHTATAMDESVFDSGFLSTPGAFFEMTFTEAHNNRTFEYFCRTHHTCCEMQGSVQVGINAPDPGDGY